MEVFQNIAGFISGIGIFITTLLGSTPPPPPAPSMPLSKQIITLAPTIEPTLPPAFYTASGYMSYLEHKIAINASIPQEGGAVTGQITGACTGDITGNYDGKDNGIITGQTVGTCKVAFAKLPGKVTFNGTVNKIEKKVYLQVTASAGPYKKSGPVTLMFK